MAKILITGASGLVGKALCQALANTQHEIIALSRNNTKIEKCNIPVYKWDIKKGYIEEEALHGIDYIIHLAGANIATKAWTKKRKKTIIQSRVRSTKLLFKYIKKYDISLKKFISASAIGYYGSNISTHIFNEDTPNGNDFLSDVCIQWEAAAEQFKSLGIPVCILRTGVVLSHQGGALPKMAAPVKWGLGAPLGSGRQYMPWIHIDDLVQAYQYAINQPIEGIYNAVATEQIRNKKFMKALAKALHRPFIMPKVPETLLKLIMGSKSTILTKGSRVSNQRIKTAGFRFKFETVEDALQDLLQQS